MAHQNKWVSVEAVRAGDGSRCLVTALLGKERIYHRTFDLRDAGARKGFATRAMNARAGVDRAQVLAELGRIAAEIHDQEPWNDRSREIDLGRVVRPTLFHLPQVSGISVPHRQHQSSHRE